jgi:tetratricopeptide (TPR) repeat protein
MDNLDGAEEEYNRLRMGTETAPYGLQRLIRLYILQGRFEESKKLARGFLEMAEKLGQGRWVRLLHIRLAELERISGHAADSLPELEKALASAVADEDFNDQRSILLYQGMAYLEMNDLEKAREVAARLKASVDAAPNKKLVRFHHYLNGMTELKKKNYSRALELFRLGLPLLNADSPFRLVFADALGAAFYQLGDLNSARQEYQRIGSFGFGRVDYGDIYSKSYYHLGKISEQQKNKAEAAEHYRKFLDLWKNADPGRPEVDDIRKRLAAI